MSNAADFKINKKGVLTKYVGHGGAVVIPDGVTAIGDRAFYRNKDMIAVTIPQGVVSVGQKAFEACDGLNTVTIPDSVTSIGYEAFYFCENLHTVTVPDSVTSIVHGAFTYCKNLARIRLPIGVSADVSKSLDFSDTLCIEISDLSALPAKYRICAALCFAADGGLKTDSRYESHMKYIKANAGKMVETAAKNMALLALLCRERCIKAKDMDAYVAAVQETGDAERMALILEYQNSGLSSKQKAGAVKQKEKQEETVIKRAVSRANQTGITGLNFVVTGDVTTFKNRKELKDFVEGQGGKVLSSISAKADFLIMNNANSDTEKTQKAESLGIEIITERQFNEKAGRRFAIENGVLTKFIGLGGDVIIPRGVTSIGCSAFSECESLTSVTIPEGVVSIGDYAFYKCKNLLAVSVPAGLLKIGNSSFSHCESLLSVSLPNSLTAIGDWAFSWCNRLTSFAIPANTISLGGHMLAYCENLASVKIPDGVTVIREGAFDGCKKMSSVVIPDSVTTLCHEVFSGCMGLTAVTIPTGVTKIGSWAFHNCENLIAVTIPDEVTTIEGWTFCNCKSLVSVTIPGSVTEIAPDKVFENCPSVSIHAPAGSYAEQYAKENNIPFVAE